MLLFFCLILTACSELCIFNAIKSVDIKTCILWIRVAAIFFSLEAGTWYLFAVTFYVKDHMAAINRHGTLIVVFFLGGFFFLFNSFSTELFYYIDDAIRVIYTGNLGRAFVVFIIIVTVSVLFIFENTFRQERYSETWTEIKPIIFGITLEALSVIVFLSYTLMYNIIPLRFLYVNSIVVMLSSLCLLFAFVRHNIYGVDIFVSRYAFYNSVVISSVGFYLFILGLIGELEIFLGKELGTLLSIGVSVVLSSFFGLAYFSRSFRLRYKSFIIRHFYKNKYDYRIEWIEFTNSISGITDWHELLPKLASNISNILSTEEASLWIIKEGEESFYLEASTKNNTTSEMFLESDIIRLMQVLPKTVDLLGEDSEVGGRLLSSHPWLLSEFKARLVVPMRVKGNITGLIIVGENSFGEKYVDDDFELLETIALQAAYVIWNIKLSEDLAAAEEKEKINKLVSFVIHDLKNCASLLNMVVQNAEEYADNLEFYKDAMETVCSTAGKINALITKISDVRVDVKLHTTKVNINNLIDTSMRNLDFLENSKVSINRNMSDAPLFAMVNTEQIQKVIVNLMLNALDAVKGEEHGRIDVSTFIVDEYAVFDVNDNGCGMDKVFVRRSLFQAFKTTKQKGMGIGLYQCKHIMEEHNGKIEVVSKKGEGSKFSIFLPKI